MIISDQPLARDGGYIGNAHTIVLVGEVWIKKELAAVQEAIHLMFRLPSPYKHLPQKNFLFLGKILG